MNKTHFLHIIRFTPDTLPSLQKYGWRLTKQVEIQPSTNIFTEEPRIHQTSRYLRNFKRLQTFKMKTTCFKQDYGQMTLLSKRLIDIEKLDILVVRDYLKNYKGFFTLTKLKEFSCSFEYEGEWRFIQSTAHELLLEKICPDPLRLLIYQTNLQSLSLDSSDCSQPHLPNLLHFRRYPRSLRRIELNNLSQHGGQISSSTKHLTTLKSLKLDFIWRYDDVLLRNLIQAFMPIFPQLDEFEITGINMNPFMKHIIHLPFTLPKAIKAECYNPFTVTHEEHHFLNPSQDFQKSLSLRINSMIDVRNHLQYFPYIQVLDLQITNYMDDSANIHSQTLQLLQSIDQLSLLKDLSLYVSLHKSNPVHKLKIFDQFKKFLTRGIPIEGFRIHIDLLVDDDQVMMLYKELEKHAPSLRKLQLIYGMVSLDKDLLMEGILNLLAKLKSIERLELAGLKFEDHTLSRLLMSLFAMSQLKILLLAEFHLVNEIARLLKAEITLKKKKIACIRLQFLLSFDTLEQIRNDPELLQLFHKSPSRLSIF